jgi:predicted MPP superfamily phosphohydrolase
MRSTYSYDLAICGHTHGGQIQLPLLGALTYHLENPDLGEGLVWRGEQAVYVSRGIGVVEVPFRVLCRPEVSLLTLV